MFKKKKLRSVINNITRKVRQLYFFSLLSFLIMSPTMAGWEVNYIDTFDSSITVALYQFDFISLKSLPANDISPLDHHLCPGVVNGTFGI